MIALLSQEFLPLRFFHFITLILDLCLISTTFKILYWTYTNFFESIVLILMLNKWSFFGFCFVGRYKDECVH